MTHTHATPAQLRARANTLDRRASDNASAGLYHAARTQRAQAQTLRQLAREAVEFHQRIAA